MRQLACQYLQVNDSQDWMREDEHAKRQNLQGPLACNPHNCGTPIEQVTQVPVDDTALDGFLLASRHVAGTVMAPKGELSFRRKPHTGLGEVLVHDNCVAEIVQIN